MIKIILGILLFCIMFILVEVRSGECLKYAIKNVLETGTILLMLAFAILLIALGVTE